MEAQISQIKSLMQKHDWYFEYSDDQRVWRKGWDEKLQLLTKMRKIPLCDLPPLLELVPNDLREKWELDLQVPRNLDYNTHPHNEDDEAW